MILGITTYYKLLLLVLHYNNWYLAKPQIKGHFYLAEEVVSEDILLTKISNYLTYSQWSLKVYLIVSVY